MPGLENIIKFSYYYDKFDGLDLERSVILLQIFKCKKENLSDDFIVYDTTFHENKLRKHYPLPDDELLVLIFIDSNGCLFTTIRRSYPTKEKYYRGLIGEEFKIEIKEG